MFYIVSNTIVLSLVCFWVIKNLTELRALIIIYCQTWELKFALGDSLIAEGTFILKPFQISLQPL
jgi:hypothetical protein